MHFFSFLSACVTVKTKDLTFRNTYKLNSDIIQTDGYYSRAAASITGLISAYIFFKNGNLYQGYFNSDSEIEELFYRKDLKENKSSWGVYRIDGDTIKMQYFTPRGNELVALWDVLEEYGLIKDSGDINFYKSVLFKKSRCLDENYNFHKMGIEPDSAN